MERIVIIGASGHAKVVIDIVENEGRYEIAGIIDRSRSEGEAFLGYRVLGGESDLPAQIADHGISGGIICIGDNARRAEIAERLASMCPDFSFVKGVHPHASIGRDVSISGGTVIMAGAVVNPGSKVGRFCIVNTLSSLDHDSEMGDFSSLAPRACTGGGVRIGRFSAVGIGATLVHGVALGEHTVVGAGATVLHDIGSYKVAYGTPARPVRERKAGDKYL